MNEFEWRQQMRGLRLPITPSRDLWGTIDATLDVRGDHSATAAPGAWRAARRPWLQAAALAGAFLLAGGIGLHLHRNAAAPDDTTALASAPWKPSDPRLSGAAVELDAARLELQQAMQQSPHSPSLQRLLARTEQQQTQLRHLVHEAG